MNDELNTTNDQDLTEDTDGHAMRGRVVTPVEDDTEGHAARAKF